MACSKRILESSAPTRSAADCSLEVDVMCSRPVHRLPLSGLLGLASLLLVTAPVDAQWWRDEPAEPVSRSLDVTVGGGALVSTDWSDFVVLGSFGGTTGTFQQVLLREFRVRPAALADVALTYWEGRYGVRLHGAFSRSCLAVGPSCREPGSMEESPFDAPRAEIGIDTWFLEVAGLIRLVEPAPGRILRPYFFLGLGAMAYDPDEGFERILPRYIDVNRPVELDEGLVVIVIDETTTFLLAQEELGFTPKVAGHVGLGTDVRLPIGKGGVGLRLEVSDHVTSSPLRIEFTRVSSGRVGGREAPLEPIVYDFGSVHNIRFAAGLVLEFGLPDRLPPVEEPR